MTLGQPVPLSKNPLSSPLAGHRGEPSLTVQIGQYPKDDSIMVEGTWVPG